MHMFAFLLFSTSKWPIVLNALSHLFLKDSVHNLLTLRSHVRCVSLVTRPVLLVIILDSRQPQSQQNRKLPTADCGYWTRRQHYITLAPWFNSVFVLFPHNHNLLPPVEDNERADEQSFLLEPRFLSSEHLFKSWHPHLKILQKCVWRLERFYRCPCLGLSEVQSASH